MVAFGHLTQHYFSNGWRDFTDPAVEAVGVFFVLSGFVIRYVTRLKYARIGEYWIDRASRIYSVIIPAILFTLLADWVAMHANPGFYAAYWGQFTDHFESRLLQNLLFTSQFWLRRTQLFSNSPLWSLSYEWLYYAIYGCAFYLRGAWRWIAAIGLVALGGPHIAFLFPLWVLGCALYELYEWLVSPRRAAWFRRVGVHAGFAIVALTGLLLHPVARLLSVVVKAIDYLALRSHHVHTDVFSMMLIYYRVSIPAAFLMLWLLVAVHGLKVEARSRWVRSIRILAEGTFPLYVIHFPLYVLVASVIPYDHGNPVAKIALLLAAIAFGVLLAFPTNRLKDAMRNRLRDWFLPGDRMPAPRSAETVAS
jgi:peptidoglycan/LPS O-acetylase OafA/YrhL